MNGDYHEERLLRLEAQMLAVQKELGESGGTLKTWLVIVALFVGPIVAVGTNRLLSQPTVEQQRLNEKVERFIDDQVRRQRENHEEAHQ